MRASLDKALLASQGSCCFLSQEAVITGLLSETSYSVTVAAYTTKGDGARSKAKVVTTTGAGRNSLTLDLLYFTFRVHRVSFPVYVSGLIH